LILTEWMYRLQSGNTDISMCTVIAISMCTVYCDTVRNHSTHGNGDKCVRIWKMREMRTPSHTQQLK